MYISICIWIYVKGEGKSRFSLTSGSAPEAAGSPLKLRRLRDLVFEVPVEVRVREDQLAARQHEVQDRQDLVGPRGHLVHHAARLVLEPFRGRFGPFTSSSRLCRGLFGKPSLAEVVAQLVHEEREEVRGQQRIVQRLTDQGVDHLEEISHPFSSEMWP